jgi:hypothetical protein
LDASTGAYFDVITETRVVGTGAYVGTRLDAGAGTKVSTDVRCR